MKDTFLSVVIPVKDEESALSVLFEALVREGERLDMAMEIIFIDDGSSDGSWREIENLTFRHRSPVRAYRLRRNMGKADALALGMREARGDVIFTLDGDLQ